MLLADVVDLSPLGHELSQVFGKTLASFVAGLIVAGLVALIGRLIRLRRLAAGRWDTTINFQQVWLEDVGHGEEKTTRVHTRTIGALPLNVFFGSPDARKMLIKSARGTHTVQSVVPMPDKLGSYVLSELEGMLRMVAPKAEFPIELWIMVPVYETFSGLGVHRPEVLLIRPKDAARFADFSKAKNFQVLRSSGGATILTVKQLQEKFALQCAEYKKLRSLGQSTTYHEEMWMVEARLDTTHLEATAEELEAGIQRSFKPVPWQKYAADLKALKLEL